MQEGGRSCSGITGLSQRLLVGRLLHRRGVMGWGLLCGMSGLGGPLDIFL